MEQLNMDQQPLNMEQQLLNMDQQPLNMEQQLLNMDKQQLLMVLLKHIKQVDGNKFIQQQLVMYQ